MKKLILITALFLSNIALSNGSGEAKITDTKDAISASLDKFESSFTHEVVDSFQGIKAWPVSGGVKAKIYLREGDAVSYSCHRHSAGEPFECH
jgi:hypothetical protein